MRPMPDLRAAMAEYDRQCLLRPVFDARGQWVRDRSLPTREATDAVENAIAAEAVRLATTATALRVRLASAVLDVLGAGG